MLRERSLWSATLLLAWTLMAPASARAECIQKTANTLLSSSIYEVVFKGRVVEVARTAVEGYRANFQVETVWKGTVPPRFDVYVWERVGEMPRFDEGQRYIVAARRLTDPNVREGVGLGATEPIAYAPTMCTDTASLSPHIESELGRGYPPSAIKR